MYWFIQYVYLKIALKIVIGSRRNCNNLGNDQNEETFVFLHYTVLEEEKPLFCYAESTSLYFRSAAGRLSNLVLLAFPLNLFGDV